jgi:hypothetical protein
MLCRGEGTVLFATTLIAMICTMTVDGREIPASVIIDLDQKTVSAADIGCGLVSRDCRVLSVTPDSISFGDDQVIEGTLNRYTGSLVLKNAATGSYLMNLTCKPAKPLF